GEAHRRVGDGDKFSRDQARVDGVVHFFRLFFCFGVPPAAVAFFFAASTLIQSRLRSPSRFCSRSNNRAIAFGSQALVSSRNLSRISARSSGCSGVPLKLSTWRVSARPSFSVTVTVEAM